MSLENLGNIGEFLGGIVVIVSLFYLAFQVRQNTESLRAETYGRALDRIAAMQARLASDSELSSLFARGLFDPNALTRAERIRFNWTMFELFGAFEFMFHQSQKGALEDELWRRWSETMSWWVSVPGVRVWWQVRPTPFSVSFTSFVESLMSGEVADPAAARRFQEFLSNAPDDLRTT